ncbi:MAG TPA: hypothetical protein VLX68_10350 [Chitinivibrionales bacterium]|nr:hypothetical protein [Chitinivibrionales bacterium]
MYNQNDPASLEKYSSAITLSDMEVFIFPELLFSLVLANAMSPALWKWRNAPWFSGMDTLTPYRRLLRTKQYIIDNFIFNLDLDTWGLTTKEKELARFSSFISKEALAQSNALFGYEGDKYYFDIDIRRHFGLDKYSTNVIPYWKTETLEAMEAFRHKPGYNTGAGECVSLSTLYAAAMFVVARLPLENIFLMATPLHSQNFVDINGGVITNNRRIVTKNMWFNGSELSEKARRALTHERITVVAHHTGYIHTFYDAATISRTDYERFSRHLSEYLSTDISFEILANFLRQNSKLQKCFQIMHDCGGKPRYIEAEKVYSYEHNSKFKVSDDTRDHLLHEIDEDEFYPEPLPNRLMLREVEEFFKSNRISLDHVASIDDLKKQLRHSCFNSEEVMKDLVKFCRITPLLPSTEKKWMPPQPIAISNSMPREQIVDYLESIRGENPVADLAFTAFRDLRRSPWKPFLKAALERNPVSIAGCAKLDIPDAARKLSELPNESIYDASRLAQPDEVWNYGQGDGLEKALCLFNVLRDRLPEEKAGLKGDGKKVIVFGGNREYEFESKKDLSLPRESDFVF